MAEPRTAWLFPGQGSQSKGMGKGLFAKHPDLVREADGILGCSIEELCLEGPPQRLNQTQHTQPALFMVNALTYREALEAGPQPSYVAGHSLGEYSALFAAGVFDFATGLRLVQRRGLLMSRAQGGGMAAVIGLTVERLRGVLDEHGLDGVDIANHNTPSQVVISGAKGDVARAVEALKKLEGLRVVPLPVSGAFHSRLMRGAQAEFAQFLRTVEFNAPNIPVISNVTARPHEQERIGERLAEQVTGRVEWVHSVRYLMGQGVAEFREIGPGKVLTGMVAAIRKEATPLVVDDERPSPAAPAPRPATPPPVRPGFAAPEWMGSRAFRDEHGCAYAYAVGSQPGGITSKELVARAAKASILSYFGAADLPLAAVDAAVRGLGAELGDDHPFGVCLPHRPDDAEAENALAELYLRHGIKRIECVRFASATPALVKYRAKGLRRLPDGQIEARHKVMAKVATAKVARAFASPPPTGIVQDLLARGEITAEQAELARSVPVADDLCVDANGDGFGGNGLFHLLPAVLDVREGTTPGAAWGKRARVGATGGMGTPEALAAAFLLGADFVVTGSINQATAEAGLCPAAKDVLDSLDEGDVALAPAPHLFELGAVTQVARKGLMFPARAAKLYQLYRSHASLDAIDRATLREIEDSYFKTSLAGALSGIDERSPKLSMLRLFKRYFDLAASWARDGDAERKADYAIYCSHSVPAFNRWAADHGLPGWRDRHVETVAAHLMEGAAEAVRRQARLAA